MYFLFFFFFFFKQKTAYEMRISDWSSDVCSSDLIAIVAADVVICRNELNYQRLVQFVDKPFTQLDLPAPSRALQGNVHEPQHSQEALVNGEIGRASCRERVCQYV